MRNVTQMAKKRYRKPHQSRAVIDRGSDYVRLRRAELSGDPSVSSDWPLDILVALNLISPEQATAGQDFMKLRFRAFGKPRGWSSGIYRRLQGEIAGEEIRDSQPILSSRYENALTRLKHAGPTALHVTTSICVYLEVPGWARKNQPLNALAQYELSALRTGLDALRSDTMRRAA